MGRPAQLVLAGPTAGRRAVLVRRVRLLVAFTIAYNVIEAVVALVTGVGAGSAALVGFGLDSVIEVASAVAVAWQFTGRDHERRELAALRVIACSFFALAAFVSFDAMTALLTRQAADHSGVGIGLAVLSLLVMPLASWVQRRTGTELGSRPAVADSKQTLLCTYMSAALLLGLLLNSLLGWWWADSIAALTIAAVAVGEGVKAWRGEVCCSPAEALVVEGRTDEGCDCC
ncbi:cation transporter [Nocardioides sp. KC13]|uniref:Cation transporter n=1 Tax=Nocardioides turkmenicus TaxID=2711220 RepID=A0A6M1R2B2_9ACTN|nr:cation transporter [Nocardioides sp. KC13]NGN91869.1 cation transporter [Nocardioides sp. KC13]